MEPEKREIDHLNYRGNQIPTVIKFVWIVLIVFGIIYLARYMWSDMVSWLKLWLK